MVIFQFANSEFTRPGISLTFIFQIRYTRPDQRVLPGRKSQEEMVTWKIRQLMIKSDDFRWDFCCIIYKVYKVPMEKYSIWMI